MKTELLNLQLSKLARAKVLLKLEIDTKDQVLVCLVLPRYLMDSFYFFPHPAPIQTRLGLQCQTPFIPYPLSLTPYLLSLIPTSCSLSPTTVSFPKFRWGLLWLLLLSQAKVKSTPSRWSKTWSSTIENKLFPREIKIVTINSLSI